MRIPPPIHRTTVRILRPAEFERLYAVMKSNEKPVLAGMLATGMRFVEAQRFQEHPDWWDGRSFINLPPGAALKVLVKMKERTIRLSEWGRRQMPMFLKNAYALPARETWDWILKERCLKAGLQAEGPRTRRWRDHDAMLPEWSVNAKTTRKTWETWLFHYYHGSYISNIQLSQGHTGATQTAHYLQLGFYEDEIKAMGKYVDGWALA